MAQTALRAADAAAARGRSVVCFPFKEEDPRVICASVRAAAGHARVGTVLCVGAAAGGPTWAAVQRVRSELEGHEGARVVLLAQERVGTFRAGKGDGMNTALRFFLEETDAQRLHFFDADIESFGAAWIDRAELGADAGWGCVRHYYARASTDAMITWLVTKVGFAKVLPRSMLNAVEQPLGGEVLLTRAAAALLWGDARSHGRSDWGVDTCYTAVLARYGGKAHKAHAALGQYRCMLIECFSAIKALKHDADFMHNMRAKGLGGFSHRFTAAAAPPRAIVERLCCSVDASADVLRAAHWTPRQESICRALPLPAEVRDGLLAARYWPRFDEAWCGEAAWLSAYDAFLDAAVDLDDADVAEILFRLFVARVVHHLTNYAVRGYDYGTARLRGYVDATAHRGLSEPAQPQL
ncbi:nucleotide-diphospho-sugar transferase [Pelagophyceae sp. CCMP2097]|nr:nucleotide-diphospho-sugar transferase [Pelagophyceae sp. CCMP2097]